MGDDRGVTFNSVEDALFLPLVLLLVWARRGRDDRWILLVASYVFYGWWDPRFLSLIVLSTVVGFVLARRIHRTDDPRRRRRLLVVSLVVNLGILSVFKYAGFFVDSLTDGLHLIGVGETSTWALGILLPVGVSFYTFQTISYTFDV